MMFKTLFDCLNNISTDKIQIEDDETVYNPYMINRYISMCNAYIPIVNEINKYNLPKSIHNDFYCYAIPKRKQYFNYIKKDKADKNYEETLVRICRYFEVGIKEATEYYNMLPKHEIEDIYQLYEH